MKNYQAKLLDIVTHPNPSLREISKELDLGLLKTDEYKKLFKDMELTMIKKDGVGLAAPQIGKNIRAIVVNTKNGLLHLVNPVLSKLSWAKQIEEEGCLSVPGVYGNVKRHKGLFCEYIDSEGNKQTIKASGFLARVLQHEVDHLDGVLFIDKVIK